MLVFLVVFAALSGYDWGVIIRPQRGKEFTQKLVDGYHLETQCGTMPGTTETPGYMRDAFTSWQTSAADLIENKLDVSYLRMWNGAGVIGRVVDTNIVAYQCTSLANKVAALETIVAKEFNNKLPHRDYAGPLYWFDATTGKVDISDVMNQSGGKANVYFYGGGKTKNGQVQIEAHGLKPPRPPQ